MYFMEINLIGFLPALLPVALTPGASFTLVMSSALSGGRRGLFNTLAGTALGIYTHALLIGLGISAVIVTVPALFAVLKIAGALWLLWLGVALIRSGMKATQGVLPETAQPVSLRGAWTANILNPKAIIFYLTVVSQFAGQQEGVSHYLMLASVHVIVMSLWLVAVSQVLVFSATKTDTLVLKKSLTWQAVYCLSYRPCTVSSAERPVWVIISPRCLLSHETSIPAGNDSLQTRTSHPVKASILCYVREIADRKGFLTEVLESRFGRCIVNPILGLRE
ncbi:hypothetical protein GCM10009414_09010 [Tatumella terrea]